MKGWVIIGTCCVLIFVVLPYSLIKSYNDSKNIELRAKEVDAKVIEINGLKSDRVVIHYIVNNKQYNANRKIPNNKRNNVGDKVRIKYDSLDAENIKIMW